MFISTSLICARQPARESVHFAMHAPEDFQRRRWPRIVQVPVVALLVLLLLPLIPLILLGYLIYGVVLQLVIWICWCTRGVNVLLVYSNSPHWQDYIEANIIPRLPPAIVKINWSERRTWKRFSLPVMAFRFFGGSREFNPLIVVFRPFRWGKTFRFWQVFRDYKHGNPVPLKTMENKLFHDLAYAGIPSREQARLEPPAEDSSNPQRPPGA